MSAASFQLITHTEDLESLAQDLNKQSLIAVDTESNSLHAYREQVCLIQFSTAKNDYLVDPLALDDLSSLARVFSSPGIETIFHAAEYDLIVLKRDYGFEFANLFDTMVAARILGRKRVGLGNLLEEELGVKLAKRYQRADWGKRPLSPEMLDYARLDTHYLVQLRKKFKAELEQTGRWPIAHEDFARMPHIIPEQSAGPNGSIWNIKGVRDLKPDQTAILQQLADYRDQQAQRADVPLFKIMGDRTLTAIAANAPRSTGELAQVEGMSDGQIRRHGEALLKAVQRGVGAEAPRRPPRSPYDEEYVERVEALRSWRKLTAREMAVESDVVLPRDVMETIAHANPHNPAQLDPLLSDLPWRKAQYSQGILKTLSALKGQR
ncbi:MAG: ribonuclease D [Chloroflexi bacterium]|nr:HRDC domain-containing protein [Chloroflexota bacterium]MQC25967.1 ribonuclease D [Chloroflexota bacterium]